MFNPPKSVSIIVPTHNEAENVAPLLQGLAVTGQAFREIIFVDAQSDDRTPEAVEGFASEHPVRVMEQDPEAPGLAAAIMEGATAATGDVLVVMDADLSHPPDRIGDLLQPIFQNVADLVIGSRYISGGSTPGWPFWRRLMSRGGALAAYPLTGIHDSLSGFFAIERERLLQIAPPTVGFKIVFETIVRGRSSLRVKEVPIAFRDRQRGKSKMSLGVALRFVARWSVAILRRTVS
jgi:dolichol-phosphate mannosyltransferase